MVPGRDAPSRMWGCLLLHRKRHVGLSFLFFPLGVEGQEDCVPPSGNHNEPGGKASMEAASGVRKKIASTGTIQILGSSDVRVNITGDVPVWGLG